MPCLPRLSLEPVHKLRLPSRLGEGLNQKIRLDDNWEGGGLGRITLFMNSPL